MFYWQREGLGDDGAADATRQGVPLWIFACMIPAEEPFASRHRVVVIGGAACKRSLEPSPATSAARRPIRTCDLDAYRRQLALTSRDVERAAPPDHFGVALEILRLLAPVSSSTSRRPPQRIAGPVDRARVDAAEHVAQIGLAQVYAVRYFAAISKVRALINVEPWPKQTLFQCKQHGFASTVVRGTDPYLSGWFCGFRDSAGRS
jgi:hypothetical protein